jgi:hypothetical protein
VEVDPGGEGQGGAGDLGGPPGHVTEHIHAQREVSRAGDGKRLAVIERLQFSQLFQILLHQVGEPPEHPAAFGGRHATPGALVKSKPRGLHGAIDIDRLGLRHMGHDLAGGGVVNGKGLT